jgi:hypothetical protein
MNRSALIADRSARSGSRRFAGARLKIHPEGALRAGVVQCNDRRNGERRKRYFGK